MERSWQATRILRWVTASLLVLAGSSLVTRRLWPTAPQFIAVLVSVVLLIGLLLWGRNRYEPGAASNLGASLLGGVLVAVTVFVVQASFEVQRQVALDQEARRRTEAEARQTLRFSLGAQQDFTGIDLSGQDLSGFYLRGKNFSQGNLFGADLTNAILIEADLTGATLITVDLSLAYLRGADLTGAALLAANLTLADLSGADLTDAFLNGADLTEAILTDADLNGADLRDTILTGADLTGADLSGADLRGARTEGGTRWPAGFDPHAHGIVQR